MDCPTCGRRLPEGQMECPHCVAAARSIHDFTPITPAASGGGAPLGFAAGTVVGLLGAFGWAWLATVFGHLVAWPAVVIGVAVGVTVRMTGGENPVAKGFVGLVSGAIGIGAGVVFIFYQVDFNIERLAEAADVTNIAMIFVGLSMARSFAGGKRVIGESGELRRALDQSKKTTK